MILDCFDKDFIRIGTIGNAVFSQYESRYRGVGMAEVIVPITKETKTFSENTKYILFDSGVMGICEGFYKKSSGGRRLSITCSLMEKILSYRVFKRTELYNGMTSQIGYQMVDRNFISPLDYKRKMPLLQNSASVPTTNILKKQYTGNTILNELEVLLEDEDLGYKITPTLVNYDPQSGEDANLSAMTFEIYAGVDRTLGNAEDNSPIIFSESLNNIIRYDYQKFWDSMKNFILVGGQGKGTTRDFVSVTDKFQTQAADSNTTCLLHFDDTTDEANVVNRITLVGAAKITNEASVLGEKSVKLSGAAADKVTTTKATIPAGDFTVEWWEYRKNNATGQGIYASHSATNTYGAILCYINSSGNLVSRMGSTDANTYNILPADSLCGNVLLNQWVHRAIVRQGTSLRVYQNGQLFATHTVLTLAPHSQTTKQLGNYFTTAASLNGFIDEFRISTVARYSGSSFELQKKPFNVVERVVFEEPVGIDRLEEFVDAKDLDDTLSDGTVLTAAEYTELLLARALAELAEKRAIESVDVEASVNASYTFGVDYNLGDLVSIIDEDLGIEIQARVTAYKVTQEGGRLHTDLEFGYKKIRLANKLFRKGVV